MIRTSRHTNSLRRAALVRSVLTRGRLAARPGPGSAISGSARTAAKAVQVCGGLALRADPPRSRHLGGTKSELGATGDTLPWAGSAACGQKRTADLAARGADAAAPLAHTATTEVD